MAGDNRSTSALFKRAEQIRRWQESETNKQDVVENHRTRKVNFTDGCVFLAACAAGDKQEVMRLLEKGADIDTANVDGLTALHAACIDDNLDMVEFLVDQGTDVNRGDMEGWTPLHATASCGFNSIAKFLIDRGADLSLVNNDGDLAIDIADSDEMECLLQQEIETRGIDCEMSRNREERRMLEDAQYWLTSGYLADRPHSKTGATALHVAAAKGYIKVMSLLLEAGADINAKDMDGWTPLHAASHWGQREAVEVLCENMADMEVRNFVGQSAFDVADSSLLPLLEELKRKQAALKLVNQNKKGPRKRKTSPTSPQSNKKEREDLRESDGTSDEDESSPNVEKRNKVNKESAMPQIIPISAMSNKSTSRSQSETRSENAFDESEVQSWRRPSSFRRNNQEEKNQKEEASRTSSTTTTTITTTTTTTTTTTASTPTPSARISSRDAEEERKRTAATEKEESALTATRERLKARSCPALSLLEEEEEGKEGGNGVQVFPSRPSSHLGGVSSTTASALVASQRLSSSDINLPSQSPTPTPVVPNTQPKGTADIPQATPTLNPVPTAIITPPTTFITPSTTHIKPSSTTVTAAPPLQEIKETLIMVTTAAPTVTTSSAVSESVSSPISTTGLVSSPSHRPLGPSLSNPVSSGSLPSSILPPISSSSSSSHTVTTITTTTTNTPAGLASLSTNHTTNSKDPRLLARSASLRERIQRNHMDSMEPQAASSSVLTTNTSPTTRSKGRSFMPPSRDEESETQRKAHAKMVRSTRRSTQGVTLEDIKSAEQLMKNKQQQQQQATSSSPDSKDLSSSTTTATTTITSTTATTAASPTSPTKPKPDSPTKAEDEERRPSWRLKLDETDKNRFSLENVRKDKSEVENDADTPTFTVQLRKKNTEEKDEEKESERNSQTREGTQAAIQRRKKPKRRSTGKVQVNMDEIDPEKRAQRSAEQQQRQGDEGSEEEEEEVETVSVAEDGVTLARCVLDEESVSEKGDAPRGSTTSLGSSRATSRSSSVGPENGDIDYKKLYEEQLAETHKVNERLRSIENELRQSRESSDLNTKKFNTRLAIAESEKREKRALERKLSEMEEELKLTKQENQRLKDENGALIRVISKLSK